MCMVASLGGREPEMIRNAVCVCFCCKASYLQKMIKLTCKNYTLYIFKKYVYIYIYMIIYMFIIIISLSFFLFLLLFLSFICENDCVYASYRINPITPALHLGQVR